MKYILTLCILMFPLVSFADKIKYVQVCERVEGCALVAEAVTLGNYCPTCTIKTIIIRDEDNSFLAIMKRHRIKLVKENPKLYSN